MLRRIVFAVLALLLVGPPASAEDSVVNPEGYWWVVREGDGCTADIAGPDLKDAFAVMIEGPDTRLFVGKAKPIRAGGGGLLTIDGVTYVFVPDYSRDRTSMAFEDPEGRMLTALKTARNVSIAVDGRPVMILNLEGKGTQRALDAARACAKGESGWWGPGVGAAPAPVAMNKEGYWRLQRTPGPQYCRAGLAAEPHGLLLLARRGQISVGVVGRSRLPRGKSGWLDMDSVTVGFKPYLSDTTITADAPLDATALAALRVARNVSISLDNTLLVSTSLDATGLPALLEDLVACSNGKAGWWGEGAAGLARID